MTDSAFSDFVEAPPAVATDPEEPFEYLRRAGREVTDVGVPDPQHFGRVVGEILAAPRGQRLEYARTRGVEPGTVVDKILRNEMAAELARDLIGVTQAEATQLVEREPGMIIRFAPQGTPVTGEGCYGRITAWVQGGRITSVG